MLELKGDIMIEIKKLDCSMSGAEVLKNIELTIEKGSFVALLGPNGSGKSTLAKHLNAVLIPKSGSVIVDGTDTRIEDKLYDIRERVGMVFQNPDSQAVSSIVEDDTAFAPENLGLDEAETEKRVDFALDAAGITHLRNRTISTLSGGQKQLAAIAGILAMRPEYMVFDESTAMLDPQARKSILECVLKLRDELGISIIWITHYMEEAARSDRVVIIKEGRILADGKPEDVLTDYALMSNAGLDTPSCVRLCMKLKEHGLDLGGLALTPKKCAELIAKAGGII